MDPSKTQPTAKLLGSSAKTSQPQPQSVPQQQANAQQQTQPQQPQQQSTSWAARLAKTFTTEGLRMALSLAPPPAPAAASEKAKSKSVTAGATSAPAVPPATLAATSGANTAPLEKPVAVSAPRARKPRRYHALPLSDLEDTDGSDSEFNINADSRVLVAPAKCSPKINAEHAPGLVPSVRRSDLAAKENVSMEHVGASEAAPIKTLTPSNKFLRPSTPPSRRATPPSHARQPNAPTATSKALRARSNPDLLRGADSGDDTDTNDSDSDSDIKVYGARRLHNFRPAVPKSQLRESYSAGSLRRPRFHFERGVKLSVDTSDKTLGRQPVQL